MLKSTHRPTERPGGPPPLPEGWTEHKAPTGHTYYYNATIKKSTYTRPAAEAPPLLTAVPHAPPQIFNPSSSFPRFGAAQDPLPSAGAVFGNANTRGNFGGHRGGAHAERRYHSQSQDRRPQPVDKPKSKHAIPGCEPWFLIHTKLGRRFAYNESKNQSFWRIPDKLKEGILALDQERIREKAEAIARPINEATSNSIQGPQIPQTIVTTKANDAEAAGPNGEDDDSSEYEEVEVTDDEDEENPSKRQRTDEKAPDEPVEFDEEDIAFQLAAMGEEYGLEQGGHDDGNMEEWEEGVEGLTLSADDASALFKDLLDDFGINPYSPWEKFVEEGKLVDDPRYTALSNMKSRREVWEAWSIDKIKQLREQRAKEEKKNPRIPYVAFLQKNANPKLYWPEFKRKYKKEPEIKDMSLSDKDREKLYREHIARLKLPQSTLKADLAALLRAQPPQQLNNTTLPTHLPSAVLCDIRFISLDPATRDPLVEALIGTLPPPTKETAAANGERKEESEAMRTERTERERRQKALEERGRQVEEEKRRQRKTLEYSKGRLREEEDEITRAMNVSKRGLRNHLLTEEG